MPRARALQQEKPLQWEAHTLQRRVAPAHSNKDPTQPHTHTKMWYLYTIEYYLAIKKNGGFPGGAVVKNPPANAGDMGSSPGPGRSHMPRSN